MERAPSQCILCNSTRRTLLFEQDRWTVYKCAECGLGVLDPRPDPDELDELYRREYFSSHYDKGVAVGSPEMKRRISQEDHRIKFFRPLKKSGRILDIGCGLGYFLYACRAVGYQVEGMDVSGDSASYVREELGIPVTTGVMDEVEFDEGSFDIITMWHALEHTPDPRVHMEKAWKWLKRDGLFIVDVPNHEGTDAVNMWDTWTGWSLPYHLYHFTPATLTALLTLFSFEPVRTKDYHSEHVKEKLKRIPLVGLVARPIAKFYSGNSVAVAARKKD